MASTYSIVIVGGGIGGLVSANFPRRQGHKITVIEAKQEYLTSNSAGGIQLTTNAQRVLNSLGFGAAFDRISDRGSIIHTKRYNDGALIQAVNKGALQHAFVHRTDLLQLLHRQAIECGVDIRQGQRWTSIQEEQSSISVGLDDGKNIVADMVIGCDGVNSKVREYVQATRGVRAEPTGSATFLVEVSKEAMEKDPSAGKLYKTGREPFHFWLGPERCIVAWTMDSESQRRVYHLQFCDFAYGSGEAYGAPDTPDTRLVTMFDNVPKFVERWSDFEEPIKYLINHAQLFVKWRMVEVPPLQAWTSDSGRIFLLGDAAHCFEPFAGQGAAMAIEDAAALATLVSRASGTNPWPEVSRAYFSIRKPRVEGVRQMVRDNVKTFGMVNGQEQEERDKKMGGKEATDWSSEQRSAWINDYDAIREAHEYDLSSNELQKVTGPAPVAKKDDV